MSQMYAPTSSIEDEYEPGLCEIRVKGHKKGNVVITVANTHTAAIPQNNTLNNTLVAIRQ
jgi:hypothetical protein